MPTCESDAYGRLRHVGRDNPAADQLTPGTEGDAGTAERFYKCMAPDGNCVS